LENPDMPDDVVLYFSPFSRSFTPLWMLEELGTPYRVETVDIGKGDQKQPGYLAINPMGKVPAVAVNGAVITETTAICLYLADRYGYGTLAPRAEDAGRGPYLRWMVFSTAVVEPAMALRNAKLEIPAHALGWGAYDDMVKSLLFALGDKPYLLGERFTALDVALGGSIGWGLFNKMLPEEPSLVAYAARIAERPANKKAGELTWPPKLMAELAAGR
jgi:glutathione S-transferase